MLGNHVKITSGYALKSSQFNDDGHGIPVVRIRDVGKDKSETFYNGDFSEEHVLENGDLLIGMDGDFRLAEWRGGKALLNQRVCKIEPCEKTLDRGYMYHMLPKQLKRIEDTTSFATVKHLSVKKIKGIDFPLPPLDQQKKIAAILDAADAYRQKTKALIEKYDQLAQSLFLEMFGDPVTNPKGWEKTKLNEVAIVSSGITKGRKKRKEDFIGDLPYMRVANVQDGYLDLSEIKTIPAYKSDLTRFNLEKGDVLMTEGGDPDKLGRGAVWQGEIETCLHQNHIYKVRVDEKLLTPLYFSKLAGSAYGKRYFLKIAKQTTGIATINKTQLSNFPVQLAPLDLQIFFDERVKIIESQKAQAQISLAKAEDLFNSLLQRAFKGELTS